jgi:hypothetical protein
MGGGPGNCANTAVGANEIVASVTLTDSVKSVFLDIIVSVLDLRLKDRHRRGRRESRVRRMAVVRRVNGLTRRPAIVVIGVDPKPRHVQRRQK